MSDGRSDSMSNRAALLVLLFGAFALWFARQTPDEPMPADAPAMLGWGLDRVAEPPDRDVSARPDRPAASAPAPQVRPILIQGPAGPLEVAAGEVLFKLGPEADPESVVSEMRVAGAVWVAESEAGLWRAAFAPATPLLEIRDRIVGIEGVAGVRPNPVVRAASCGPGDLVGGPQWEAPFLGVSGCPSDSDLPPVVIAVLDTGVAYENYGEYVQVPELAGVPVVDPWDFVNDDAHANDDHQHGTHIASLIAARDRLRGSAPNPVLMPVKVLDHEMVGTAWTLLQGLEWAVSHGAEVINLSLTYGPGYIASADLHAALAYAEAEGVVVVGAAGNAGTDDHTAYPAAIASVIAVGGLRYHSDDEIKHTEYSNSGWGLDLSSAGGDLDEDKNEDGIPDGLLGQTISPSDPSEVGYWVMAGTSQAAGIVSGHASWLLAEGVPAPQVREALQVGSRGPKDKAEGKAEFGFGVASPDAFLEMLAGPGLPDIPPLFLNAVVGFQDEGDRTRAVVHVEVIDELGAAVDGVKVRAHFEGADGKNVEKSTDSDGRAVLESDAFELDSDVDAILIAFVVDSVEVDLRDELDADYRYAPGVERKFDHFPVHPGGFYRLAEGNAAVMADALGASDGGILLEVSAGGAACDLFDCDKLDPTLNARSFGSGFGSSTVHLAFNHRYLQAVGGAGFGSSTIGLNFASPLWFPWGSSDEAEYTEYSGSGFGSSTVGVLKWDWSLFGTGFGSSTVGLLSYDPTLWGSGFGSSTIGLLSFGSPLWGNGFGSSTVHAFRRTSSMWGSGFGSSTIGLLPLGWRLSGTGFGSSTVGVLDWNWGLFGASAADSASASVEATGLGAAETNL